MAAGVAGDQPGRAGANDTTGRTAESRAQSVVSGLNGEASRFTPNADTDLEASQILACGQLRYNAQAAFSDAETASAPGPRRMFFCPHEANRTASGGPARSLALVVNMQALCGIFANADIKGIVGAAKRVAVVHEDALRLAQTTGSLRTKFHFAKFWRRGELNFFRALIGRNLLILRSASNAKIAQNA